MNSEIKLIFITGLILSILIGSTTINAYTITLDEKGTRGHTLLCTESMKPTFTCRNTLKMTLITSEENYEINDIVAYSPTIEQRNIMKKNGIKEIPTYLIHRITNITKENIELKGDNNDYTDNEILGQIKPYQIRYKITEII